MTVSYCVPVELPSLSFCIPCTHQNDPGIYSCLIQTLQDISEMQSTDGNMENQISEPR